MKRWIALGMVALMVVGFGALAWGVDATLEIKEDCANISVGDFGAWYNSYNPIGTAALDPMAADDTSKYYSWAGVTGNANYDHKVCVTIQTPLTNSTAGTTLETSLAVENLGGDASGATAAVAVVPGGGASIEVTLTHSTGSFSFDVVVDVQRKGYADHEGSYTATVNVVCGPCPT